MRVAALLVTSMILASGMGGCISQTEDGATSTSQAGDASSSPGSGPASDPDGARQADPDDRRPTFLGNIWTRTPEACGDVKELAGETWDETPFVCGTQRPGWQDHWNQVTPEFEGKWGWVQPEGPLVYHFDHPVDIQDMDGTYNFARGNGHPIRYTNLVWGTGQPTWMTPLPPEQQRGHIEDWFAAVAERYPDLDWIEVVNEPIHRPPDCDHPSNQGPQACLESGDYIDALGGYNGTDGTGYDWVLNAFRLAREIFGPDTKLMINEYLKVYEEELGVLARYVELIELLQEEDLIDGVGIQQHVIDSAPVDPDWIREQRDRLAVGAGDLPIQVTELTIVGSGPEGEVIQLDNYRRIIPIWWEHPQVEGVTIWGWRPGTWQPGANLVHDDGSYKPAMHWLMAYVNETAPVITPGQSFVLDGEDGDVVGTAEATDWASEIGRPELRTFHWQIVGGTSAPGFAVDEATGEVTIGDPKAIEFHETNHSLRLTVNDGFHTSGEEAVAITIPDEMTVCHTGETTTIQRTTVLGHLEHGDSLGAC